MTLVPFAIIQASHSSTISVVALDVGSSVVLGSVILNLWFGITYASTQPLICTELHYVKYSECNIWFVVTKPFKIGLLGLLKSMQSAQLQCSSVFPQCPYFEQQKYSPEASHCAGAPFGKGASTPHRPSNRNTWLSMATSLAASVGERVIV